MDDMDVLIGRINARIQTCEKLLNQTGIKLFIEGLIDGYNNVLKDIKNIKKEG